MSIKHIKHLVKSAANRLGYDIRRLNTGGPRRILSESFIFVRGLGFRPKTVVDVGVANGTPGLYSAFQDSYFLLIEPLKEFEPQLVSILKQYKGSYVLAVAGLSAKQVTFNVCPNELPVSSLYKETMGDEVDRQERTIPMVRLDDVILEKRLQGPYLIKIDAQGAELDILNGCQQTLLETEVVVLEVSMFQCMKGAPEFYDVIVYMKERGFVAYDIILGFNRPLDNALGKIDMVFVKEKGQFRRDHSLYTIEQRKKFYHS